MNYKKSNADVSQPRGAAADELNRAKERLIQWRAKRLDVTSAEAEALLDEERRSWNAVPHEDDEAELNRTLADIEESEYPTPDCLDPHEMEDVAMGKLPEGRQEHTANCPFCRTLLDMASPTNERVDAFLDEVRETCGAAGLVREDFALGGAEADVGLSRDDQQTHRQDVPVATRRLDRELGLLLGLAASFIFIYLGSGNPSQFGAMTAPAHSARLSAIQKNDSIRNKINDLAEFLTSHASDPSQELKIITISPDRSRMAIKKGDGTVILWDLAAKQRVREFNTDEGASALLGFSADGKLLGGDARTFEASAMLIVE